VVVSPPRAFTQRSRRADSWIRLTYFHCGVRLAPGSRKYTGSIHLIQQTPIYPSTIGVEVIAKLPALDVTRALAWFGGFLVDPDGHLQESRPAIGAQSQNHFDGLKNRRSPKSRSTIAC
jgi:hypothetical protein